MDSSTAISDVASELRWRIRSSLADTPGRDEIIALVNSMEQRIIELVIELEDALRKDDERQVLLAITKTHSKQLQVMVSAAMKRIAELEQQVEAERYQHYLTCESEGLQWYGDIPKEAQDENK